MLGHIMAGNEDRYMVGAGDFALIDWGAESGADAGLALCDFRDVGVAGLPLASIGEGVVISTSSAMALTRVIRARDAVYSRRLHRAQEMTTDNAETAERAEPTFLARGFRSS